MRRGDFSAAWNISDRVLEERTNEVCSHWPRHLQFVWRGQSLVGKRVLIRCYHGLGDTLQYIRLVSLVKRVASRVIVWAQPALIPLLQTAAGIDHLLPLHDGSPEVEYDVDVELMELPHIFRLTLDTLPKKVPYLQVEPAPRAVEVQEPAYLEVGLVWQAGEWDARRSLPLSEVRFWARIPGVRLHALQRGRALAEWSDSIGPNSGSDDPLIVARRMLALDLVISVDSMPAHLAGALGVPVWTLLHADPDWRWMLEREDSPWYPTMRLFRQTEPGSWKTVTERVAIELVRRVSSSGRVLADIGTVHRRGRTKLRPWRASTRE